MSGEMFFFLIFGALALGGGFGTVIAPNLVHAGLYLMLSLFGVAGLYVLLAAPFLAVVQVIVYMGGIAVLIMIAVMLTRDVTRAERHPNEGWYMSAILAAALFAALAFVLHFLYAGPGSAFEETPAADPPADTVHELGTAFAGGHVLPFEAASLLLAAALIGSLMLLRRPVPGEWRDDTE
jgi:NADH-quinone oxidoreductase subunit J